MIELALICGLQLILIGVLVVDRRSERQEVRAERADLLQRVSETQQQTVTRHHTEQIAHESPRAVNPDLDEDHWVSKEDLAELVARQELNGGD